MEALSDCPIRKQGTTTVRTVMLLLLAVAVAAFLRLYHLDQQSLNFDDINGMIGAGEPSLAGSLRESLDANSYSVPLYYILQYCWAQCFGPAPETIRGLSVLIGLLAIPCIYLLGRDTVGRTAALIACFLFALSPGQIFRDQEPRHYGLLVLVAVCAVFSLRRALVGGRLRWFVANILLSTLVIWTHAFGMFLVLSEGIYLLFYVRGRLRLLAVWFGVFAVNIVLLLSWIYITPGSDEFADVPRTPPTVAELFSVMFGADSNLMSNPFPESYSTWPIVPRQWGASLAVPRRTIGGGLEYALLGCVVWVSLRVVWRMFSHGGRRDAGYPQAEIAGYLLVLTFFAMPPLLLTAASYAWRSILMARFIQYCYVGLHLLAGAAIQSLPGRMARTVATASILLVYVYIVSLVVPNPTRTEWNHVVRVIQADASSSDVVLVGERGGYFSMLILQKVVTLSEFPPVYPAHTLQAVCDKTVCFLREHGARSPGQKPGVWFVADLNYGRFSLHNLDNCLSARDLEFTKTLYPADSGLCLYHIRPKAVPYSPPAQAPDIETGVDYGRILDETGLSFPNEKKRQEALRGLRHVYDSGDLPREPSPLSSLTILLLQEGYADLALQDAQEQIRRNSADEFSMIPLLLDQGDARSVRTLIAKAPAEPALQPFLYAIRAYCSILEGDTAGALKETTGIRRLYDTLYWRNYTDFLDAVARSDVAAIRSLAPEEMYQEGPLIIPKPLRDKMGFRYTPCEGD